MGPRHVRRFQNSLIDVDSEKIADWSFQASVEEEENGGKVIFCLTFVVLESEATLQVIFLNTNVEATYSRACDLLQCPLPFP